MAEAQAVTRRFQGADTYMTDQCRINHTLAKADLAAFTAKDQQVDSDYMAAWEAVIEAAETVVADTAVVDQQVQLTDAVKNLMVAAQEKYGDIKYFVTKRNPAPLSAGIQGEFGLNDYEPARKNVKRMIQFLDEMHNAAVKYKNELFERGASPADIDGIATIRIALQLARTNQGVFIKGRPKLSEDRIRTLNAAYDKLDDINALAQRVYRTDKARRDQFVYDPSKDHADFAEFTGTVPAGQTKLVAEVPYDGAREITFQNTGIAALVFFLSTDGVQPGEGGPLSIAGGAEVIKRMDELGAEGIKVMVKNMDAGEDGAYEVEIAND